MTTEPKPRTESEVDLCDRLRDWAERLGFEVYPEVAGWDLVLVATERVETGRLGGIFGRAEIGYQVGIHTKLRASCEVLAQALPPAADYPFSYPHFGYVAAPRPGEGFRTLARHLGIGVIDTDPQARTWNGRAKSAGPDPVVRSQPPLRLDKPLALPPVASRAILAGAPSPRVLSEWRVKAIRFLIWARTQENFTTADLGRFGISRAWADRWGDHVDTVIEKRRGRPVRVYRYRLVADVSRLPDAGYRDVAAEIAAADAKGAA